MGPPPASRGYPSSASTIRRRTLEATPDEEALDDQAGRLLATWRGMAVRPEVLVVHDIRQAEPVIEWARQEGELLTVVHAHTHRPSVTRQDTVTVVDPGTAARPGMRAWAAILRPCTPSRCSSSPATSRLDFWP